MSRCTRAVLYSENLRHNLEEIRKYTDKNVKLCVAVKADGYGHNAVLAAKLAVQCGAEYLAVATVDEGIELRENDIKANILLLSLCTPEEMEDLFQYHITPLVFSEPYINEMLKQGKKAGVKDFPVHLAVDTGMGRIGCYPQDAAHEAQLINSTGTLKLAGMCTHFAVSDSLAKEHQDFTEEQFKAFCQGVEGVKNAGIDPGVCSCGSSAALLNNKNMHFDMVRPGIITYGYYPDQITKEYLQSKGQHFDIKPVLALETKVVAIRRFPKGKSASYGRTWTAEKDTDIAVLPIGYADGLLRRYSPGLQVTINGKNYPVVGRICMDQCMVDIGLDNKDVKLWDKVIIFGPKEKGALNTAEDLAAIGKTISYEVLTAISKRVRRDVE